MNISQIEFPSRPLTIKRGTISVPGTYWFALPVLLALAGFMLATEGPGILRDYQISKDPLEIRESDISGDCKTRKVVFTTCVANVSYEHAGLSYKKSIDIMFVDLHSGDYQTGLVISAKDPDLATISLGLETLWNRVITLSVIVSVIGFGSFAILLALIRAARAGLALQKAAPTKLVPVAITAVTEKRSRLFVTYADTVRDANTKRQSFTYLERGRIPLVIGHDKTRDVALGVLHGKSPLLVLLDDHLERVVLTEQEKNLALTSLSPMLKNQTTDRLSSSGLASERKSGWLRGLVTLCIGLVVIAVAVVGYWFWYVTSAASQYNSPGMDINNMMPGSLNEWGCARLEERFSPGPAPFGCAAPDHRSWK